MAVAAAAALPTLESIITWSTEHLEDAAGRWRSHAERSERVVEMHRDSVNAPGGTEWAGRAKDAAYDNATKRLSVTREQSRVTETAAKIAENGAHDIQGAKRDTLSAIAEAGDAGFRVTQALTVRDGRPYELLTAAARRTEAMGHEEDIRWRALQLVQTDALVRSRLLEKAAELNGIGFDHQSGRDEDPTHMVDEHGIKDETLSDARRKAVEYADKWADRHNSDYPEYGQDCTNFVSQALRAGGFEDQGDGIDDWHHGDRDDWYFDKDSLNRYNHDSETWYNAAASHDYLTQHSGRGEILGVTPTPAAAPLDPLAPSKAGLSPGDLIYYKDNQGKIDHVAMYVGQSRLSDGSLVDVVDQHSGADNYRKNWMPVDPSFIGGPAQAEFVHLKYPNG